MDERIDELVDALGCSIAEAKDIIATDKAIDRGERVPHDLSKEQEKMAKKFANATTHKKPAVYQFQKRERKANPTKRELIAFLKDALGEYADLQDLAVTNEERQIAFALGGNKYEITLVQKRAPKAK